MLLHRSGRTGRAGRKGTSVLVVPVNRRRRAEELLSIPACSALGRRAGRRRHRGARRRPPDRRRDVCRPARRGRNAADPPAAGRAHARTGGGRADPSAARPDAGTGGIVAGGGVERRSGRRGRRVRLVQPEPGPAPPADPKWLVPLICRMGGVEKRDIGAIRIFDRETTDASGGLSDASRAGARERAVKP